MVCNFYIFIYINIYIYKNYTLQREDTGVSKTAPRDSRPESLQLLQFQRVTAVAVFRRSPKGFEPYREVSRSVCKICSVLFDYREIDKSYCIFGTDSSSFKIPKQAGKQLPSH